MWCRACQQDVPGVVTSPQNRRVSCARCGQPLQLNTETESYHAQASAPRFHFSALETGVGAGKPTTGDDLPEFEELEDWDFEETLRHVRQMVQSATAEPEADLPVHKIAPADAHTRDAQTTSTPATPHDSLPWLLLALGLAVFACGAALVGLSLAKNSTPLWQLGLPMVFGGQLAVLLVVVWQLETVWHSNRAMFAVTHAVDEQLRTLRVHGPHVPLIDPDAVALSRLTSAESDPHVVLDDLRTRLDTLAARLNNERDAA